MNFNIDWGFTLAVVVVGILVVFVVLIVLVLLCTLMGMAFRKADSNKKAKLDAQMKDPALEKVSTVVTKAVTIKAVEKGIPNEVIAAISAAVACMMGKDAAFTVKSIKRTRGTRSAWNLAGVQDSTRPF